MRVVLTDPAHLTPEAIRDFRGLPATVFEEGVPTSPDQVLDRIGGAEIAVTSYVKLGREVLDAARVVAPNLAYLVLPASGYQGVDCSRARELGIGVVNTPTHNAQAVAEHVLALTFNVARQVSYAQMSLRDGQWRGGTFHGFELQGSMMGIIGNGNIGRRVESMARGIGMRVLSASPRAACNEIDDVVGNADVVCITAPLTDQTYHLIDEQRIRLMRSHAVLINVSRGPLVDQRALLSALKEGRIAGAGLDVFEGEPVVGAPNKTISTEIRELCALPNVVGTPHIGWNTRQSAVRQGLELMANVRACIEGRPTNLVNATNAFVSA